MKKLSILFLLIFATPALAFVPPQEGFRQFGFWETSAYLGFDFGMGIAKSEKDFMNLDEKVDAFFGNIGASGGYKIPFVRVGLEAGGAWGRQEFLGKNEKIGFTALYLMPHVFLELDWPGIFVPYVGYSYGVGTLATRHEYQVITTWPYRTEKESNSKTRVNQTSAITLGNTITYFGSENPDSVGQLYKSTDNLNLGKHEYRHVLQADVLGPLFLPLYLGTGGWGYGDWKPSFMENDANDYSREQMKQNNTYETHNPKR